MKSTTPNPTGTIDPPDEDPEEELFREAYETGVIKARSRLDNRFRRAHPAGSPQHKEYMETPEELKMAFKVKWAVKKWKVVKSRRETMNKLVKSHVLRGQMYTFGGLVMLYGGWTWAPAIAGAKNTAAKCYLLGGRYCETDEYSGLMMFRAVSKQDAEEFNRTWTDRVEACNPQNAEHDDGADDDAADDNEGPDNEGTSEPWTGGKERRATSEPSTRGKQRRGKNTPAEPDPETKQTPQKERTKLTEHIHAATKLNARFSKTLARARDVMKSIEREIESSRTEPTRAKGRF